MNGLSFNFPFVNCLLISFRTAAINNLLSTIELTASFDLIIIKQVLFIIIYLQLLNCEYFLVSVAETIEGFVVDYFDYLFIVLFLIFADKLSQIF